MPLDLNQLYRAVEDLDGRETEEYLDLLDLDDLAALLRRHDAAVKALGDVRSEIARRIEKLSAGVSQATEAGYVAVEKGGAWRYRNEDVAKTLAARVADEVVDRETGEIPPVAAIVEASALAVAEATGALADSFVGWRKKKLHEHGIDIADRRFRFWKESESPAKVTVK